MLLFTPGPTPVPEFIRQAMATPTLHHRTPEFEAIFAKTRKLLKKLLQMREVVMLASSGTGAMEAALLSLCAKKALTINCGKFGERWGKIASAHKVEFTELKNEWNVPVALSDVLEVLRKDSKIDVICMQACESAGGLRLPFEDIAKAVRDEFPRVMIIVDAITAMGVEPLDTTCVDALIGGSQKAFMLPPGLAILGLSSRAVNKIKRRNVGYYFNLAIELKNQQNNTTAWTAPTTIITGLCAFLEHAFKEGYENIFTHTKARSFAADSALESLGLQIYPLIPALSMSCVYDEQADEIRKIMKKDFGVNVAGGQDRLKGKIFRINHMGLIDPAETAWALNAVELTLEKMGRGNFSGRANETFCQQYFSLLK